MVIGFLSLQPVVNMISPQQIMNTSFDPLDLVNTYGAFGSVGRERLNVVFEGTDAATPDAQRSVEGISVRGVARGVEPAAAADCALPAAARLANVVRRHERAGGISVDAASGLETLHNDPGALGLFAGNPFPEKPPHYIRAVLYRYAFAPPGNPAGNWWKREELGIWLPPLSADDPHLLSILRQAGWLGMYIP